MCTISKIYQAYKNSEFAQKLYKNSKFAKRIWRKINPAVLTAEYKQETINRLSVKRFLPTTLCESNTNGSKIKIRFLYTYAGTWNSIEPILSIFQKDLNYDVLVLLNEGSDLERRITQCILHDLPYTLIGTKDYSLAVDKPDIFILYQSTDIADYGDIRGTAKLIIAPSMQVIAYEESLQELLDFTFQKGLGKYKPDYILFDSLVFQLIQEAGITQYHGSSIVEMGNVKYDRIYTAVTGGRPVSAWEKLHGKKTVLYCPDHGYNFYSPNEDVSFDIFGADLFQWAWEHPDIGIIFRPHPTLVNELTNMEIWTASDIRSLKQAISQSPNVVWDEHESYDEAYASCDAILTDARCGITASALPIGKPIGVLYRDETVKPYHPELNSVLYQIKNHDQLYAFLEMVRTGEDPMKEVREAAAKKFVMHFDGKNAQRIKDFIDEKWREYQEHGVGSRE